MSNRRLVLGNVRLALSPGGTTEEEDEMQFYQVHGDIYIFMCWNLASATMMPCVDTIHGSSTVLFGPLFLSRKCETTKLAVRL